MRQNNRKAERSRWIERKSNLLTEKSKQEGKHARAQPKKRRIRDSLQENQWTVQSWKGQRSRECESRNKSWTFKRSLRTFRESCPENEGKQVSRCLRRNNRTQLLLHRPPHPAERDSTCCCSWPLWLWEKKREKAEVVAATEFDRCRVKERKIGKRSMRPPLVKEMVRAGKRRMLHHFLVCRFSVMRFGSKVFSLSGPVLCLITPRLRSL